MKKFKKFTYILVVISFVFSILITPYGAVLAQEVPASAETPDLAETYQPPSTTESSQSEETSQETPAEEPLQTPLPAETPAPAESEGMQNSESTPLPATDSQTTPSATSTPVSELTTTATPTGVVQDGQTGNVLVETGDANASGSISNLGNINTLTGAADQSGEGGATITNQGNGSDSTNTGAVLVDTNSTNSQTNEGNLNNGLTLSSDSGVNSASFNSGGDSAIISGDANTTGSISNFVNTNADGIMLAEFNIVEDYTGDILLDFLASCISGCPGIESGAESYIAAENSGNGADSTNQASAEVIDNNSSFQGNDADVTNNLVLSANSGDNQTDFNTGGDNRITSGDANVAGSIFNFVNNNILGGAAVIGVVNIFGDLVGDILIPENVFSALGISGSGNNSEVNLSNSQNGSASDNSAQVNQDTSSQQTQTNGASITNNIQTTAETGNNQMDYNTGGDNSMQTGDASVDINVANLANMNVIGGAFWVVLINEAGNWLGKIIALPGSTVGGSAALSSGQVSTDENGSVSVTNNQNGTGSVNQGEINQSSQDSTNQQNTANITNNVNLSANSGGNSASFNTGGDNMIFSGDANIVLDIVNFVNNNFINSNVLVTIVNVFGSWAGDLFTPGTKKEVAQNPDDSSQSNESNQNNTSSPDQSSSDSQNSSVQESTETSVVKRSTSTLVTGVRQQVAGIQVQAEELAENTPEVFFAINPENDGQGNPLRINLAWGLFALPLVAGYFLIRRLKVKREV